MKLYLVFALCCVLVYGKSIPKLPQCKRSDPQIEKCIIQNIETIRPTLKEGIPELKLPALEPFKMDVLNIDTTLTGVTLKSRATNIVAYGGSDFQIKQLKVGLDNKYTAELQLFLPHLDVTADYSTRGSRMLFMKLEGNGKFKGSFTGVSVAVKCVASPVMKDGVEYLQLDSIVTKVSIANGDLNVSPQEWGFSARAASSFIRSNPNLILTTLSPAIDAAAAPVAKQIIDNVLATVPLSEVLID